MVEDGGAHPGRPRADHADDLRRARAAAARDPDALRATVERMSRRLLRIALHITSDWHEAEDLCQEALLGITRSEVLLAYRGAGSLDGYLSTVGARAMIDHGRGERAWRELIELDDGGGSAATPAAPEAPWRSLDPAVRDAVRALPARARTVLVLIAIGDMTYEQVAELTGLPLGTVKSAYHRARSQLRAGLPAPG